jgi:hypothetical protein
MHFSLIRSRRTPVNSAHGLVAGLAILLAALAAPAAAVQIPATSAEGFPNGRTSNDLPGNAIDGSTATFTWTTETNNTESPSFLAIGFAASDVNRLRVFKTNESGGGTGTGVKNLVIQYTTGTGALSSRSWSNVPNLRSGFNGAEPLTAAAVNADGTVSLDNHNGSFASLTFDTVQATGLRVGFSNITATGSCSVNPNGPCNHYRVAELQAHLEGAFTPPPPEPGFEITSVEGTGTRVRVRNTNTNQQRAVGEGDEVHPGEEIFVIGGDDAEVEAEDGDGNEVLMQSSSQSNTCGNAAEEGLGPGRIQFEGGVEQDLVQTNVPAFETTCGEAEIQSSAGSGTQAVADAAGVTFALTPEARAEVRGRARVVRNPRRGETTLANRRGSVAVTPANPALRRLRLTPGRQVRVTRTSIGAPFPLVPDLVNEIPSPRQVRAGPATVTAPSKLSLRSLKSSKCVRVAVRSARAARVLVTIFSGRRSVRLFGQRLVVFAAKGRKLTCITVPRRAKTFNVRTPLRFAVGYALGSRRRPGQRSPAPVIRTIKLVP